MTTWEISSDRITGTRRLWMQPSVVGRATRCVTFLDAELYLERVQARAIVEQLQRVGDLPPTAFVYLSSRDAAARHLDFTCNGEYASFLAHDLVPWIERNHGDFEQHYLAGLSLSGLAACFAAWQHPQVFSGSLCQSPSAWWNDEWLTSAIDPMTVSPGRFWISVGDQELEAGVSHPPTGLVQGISQLESVCRMVKRLNESKATLRFNEFCGGHDPQCWAAELPLALPWLLASGD